MKLKVFNKNILIISLSILCLVCTMFGLCSSTSANADVGIYYEGVYVRETYAVNEEFTIPEAMLKQSNNYYNAMGILTFPSGKAVTGKTTLVEAGEYSLEYRSLVYGKILSQSTKFNVYETLYSVSGFRSSATYGSSSLAPNKSGIVVSLASGDKFILNKTIDLNKVDKLNNLISFFVTPEEQGNLDVAKVHITFTDVYNPENFVTVTAKRYESNSQTVHEETSLYVVAGASTQTPVGVQKMSSGSVYYNGEYYQVNESESNQKYGTDFKLALKGEPYSKYGADEFGVSWDYENRIIYGCDATHRGYKMITDLDAPEFYNELWGGFTTGEVIMTLHASNYSASKFNFVVTQLYGENVDSNVYVDQEKPTINLDLGEYSDELPKAILGKPYSVFPATAVDAKDGNVLVKTNVYYNYGSSNRINVTLTDGKFIPEQVRDYTIVYTATDNAGNVAKEVLTINVVDDTYPLSVDFEQGYAQNGFAGQKITLATPIVNSLLSKYKIKINVNCNGKQYLVEDGEFVPMSAGTYNVVYNIENYVESTQNSYEIEVSASDKPIFLNQPTLPKYFIKNATYKLDVPTAVHFSNGVAENAQVKIIYKNDDKNTENIADANGFKVNAEEKVTLIYVVSNKGQEKELVYEIPVVKTGYGSSILLFHRYFATENATVSQADLGVAVTTASNDNKIEFINRLSLSEVSLDITLNENASAFSGLDFYFTNALNNNCKIKVSLRNSNGKTTFSVNDGRVFNMDYNWGVAGNESVNILIDFAQATVTFATRTVAFDTDCYGNEYISNGKFALDIEMVMLGVTSEGGFEINGICTQSFKKLIRKDIVAPTIIAETKKGSFAKGSTVILTSASATDVLDPYTTYSMHVIAPSGNYAISVDGITLEMGTSAKRSYEIKLTEAGSYMVYYFAEDGMGNQSEFSYSINVVDMTPPTLSVNTDTVYVKVGDSVNVKKFEAQDETSQATVMITLTNNFAFVKEIDKDDKLSFDVAGEYIVTYYAYDNENNFTTLSYKIVVFAN